MKDRKIKLFLGAYVNFPNAQNINCDHIARYIDKDKFEVHAMYTTMCPVNKSEYKKLGIRLHKLIHHRFIWYWCKYLTMRFGKYDIYYLPKAEKMDVSVAKAMRGGNCVFVSSVENVIGGGVLDSDLHRNYYTKLMDFTFAISNCIRESLKANWNFDAPVLHLGVDPIGGVQTDKSAVKRVIWVGSLIKRKRPLYLLECAKAFPDLDFTMIGDGEEASSVKEIISRDKITNVTLTGRISNDDVYRCMKECDLLLMTSDNEGLPKVIQEAAQCGLPSIYIGEQYDVDFIESGVNGYKVLSLDEMKERIRYLLDNPSEYQAMSKAANESIQPYLWSVLIKKYENYFEELLRSKRK